MSRQAPDDVNWLALDVSSGSPHRAAYGDRDRGLLVGTGLDAQDASLRSGTAQVVSMSKPGSAFGSFNFVYGQKWLVGSATMGVLYGRSLRSLRSLRSSRLVPRHGSRSLPCSSGYGPRWPKRRLNTNAVPKSA